MSKKPNTKSPDPARKPSRRAIVLSLASATVAGVSPGVVQAMSNDTTGVLIEPASGNTVRIDMNNALRFVPDNITIKVGTTVEWRNVESYPHSVTADPALVRNPANTKLPPGAKAFNSGRINGGKSWRHTFKVAGAYHYFCIPHEGSGMLGTVIVK